jgi:tetratricopeptide (TPR) repeat protein
MPLYLRTLGGLRLEGSSFSRPKPLLLLAYLALEGAKPRRYLADVFFMEASDRMNSLSRALSYLRQEVPGVIEADNKRVWSAVNCDASELLSLTDSRQFEKCLELYQGAFAADYDLGLSEELEEWLYAKREYLAATMREGLLHLAEDLARHGDFAKAAKHAEYAYTLAGAGELEPELLGRYYALLSAAESPYATKLKTEASEYGINLAATPETTRMQLHPVFIGRDRELGRLKNLEPRHWAWVKGGVGIGKTSLLKQLSGHYLPGRNGLPFATLEPLVTDVLNEGRETVLRKLSKLTGTLLVDDWELVDGESQELITKLKALKPEWKVIISSAQPPVFAVDTLIELSNLPEKALETHAEAWEKTGGVPRLVAAQLKGESLEQALETTLTALSKESRSIYFALTLLDNPDLSLVRRALELKAGVMAAGLDELVSAGLLEISGRGNLKQLARTYLNTKPNLLAALALQLAGQLSDIEAFPLYQAAKLLWSETDMPKVRKAYVAWAKEILERGFPQRAADVLDEVEMDDEVRLLKAQALERAGLYKDAFEIISNTFETPEISGLKAVLYWRLGHLIEAEAKANLALEGDERTRAAAFNTIGNLAQARGQYDKAEHLFRKVAALWRVQGNRTELAQALSNVSLAMGESGADPQMIEPILSEALNMVSDHPQLRATILNNLGFLVYERSKEYKKCEQVYEEVFLLHEQFGLSSSLIHAKNNLGVVYLLQGEVDKATECYKSAIEISQISGDKMMLGMGLANLAEITKDWEMWTEALNALKEIGLTAIVGELWTSLPKDHPFQYYSDQSEYPQAISIVKRGEREYV